MDTRRQAVVAVGILVVLATSVILFRARRTQDSSRSTQPSAGPVTGISALGVIEPEGGIIKVTGPRFLGPSLVREIRVTLGQKLRKGDEIAVLDSYERLAAAARSAVGALGAAKARVEIARARLESGEPEALRAELEALEAEREQLRLEAERVENLYQSGFTTASERDRARAAHRSKEQTAIAARHRLLTAGRSYPSELVEAEGEAARAAADLDRSRAERDLSVIRAPFDGQVIEIMAREGEAIPDEGLIRFGRTDRMEAVAEVDQASAPLLRAGARARVRGDGFKGELLGTVKEIGRVVRRNKFVNPDLDADLDARVLEVRILLADAAAAAALSNARVVCIIEP
jgi:HlyD family secretion protein